MKTPIISVPNYATHSDIWETFGAFCFTPECFGVLQRESLRKWLWVFVVRGVCNVGGNILKVASGRDCAGEVELKIGSPLYADCHVNLG